MVYWMALKDLNVPAFPPPSAVLIFMGQASKKKVAALLEFGAGRELIGLRRSCEVARRIMQEEPDTLGLSMGGVDPFIDD